MTLRATVLPAEANQTVTWSVNKSGVVDVDQSGLVTPLAAGSCLVTATTFDGRSASCQVSVWGNDSDGNARFLVDEDSFKGYGWWKPLNIRNGVNPATDPISLTLRQAGGNSNSSYGIHFCYADSLNYYSMSIISQGYYRLFKRVAGATTMIQDWTANPDLNAGIGSTNSVSISMPAAGTISIRFNGGTAIDFNDSSFTSGNLAIFAGISNDEDFPTTPLDIRYRITAPMTFPSAHRYEVYSVSPASLAGMTNDQILDMGFAPWRSAYSSLLSPLGANAANETATFAAEMGESCILVCAPPESENYAGVDAVQLLNPVTDASWGYFGLDYAGNPVSASSNTANTPNYANAQGAPDGNVVRIGTTGSGTVGSGGYALYYMASTLNALPSGMTDGVTTMRVRVHCAP
jgi:hypothetical protein